MDELTIEEFVPQGPEREPRGAILLNGRQVGIYRCAEERDSILLELNEELELAE